jgi:hypothetical protein
MDWRRDEPGRAQKMSQRRKSQYSTTVNAYLRVATRGWEWADLESEGELEGRDGRGRRDRARDHILSARGEGEHNLRVL